MLLSLFNRHDNDSSNDFFSFDPYTFDSWTCFTVSIIHGIGLKFRSPRPETSDT